MFETFYLKLFRRKPKVTSLKDRKKTLTPCSLLVTQYISLNHSRTQLYQFRTRYVRNVLFETFSQKTQGDIIKRQKKTLTPCSLLVTQYISLNHSRTQLYQFRTRYVRNVLFETFSQKTQGDIIKKQKKNINTLFTSCNPVYLAEPLSYSTVPVSYPLCSKRSI